MISPTMIVRAEVEKNQNETTTSMVRRFSRKVKNSGLLRNARKFRFYSRPVSNFKQKKSAITRIKRGVAVEKQIKLGKFDYGKKRGSGRR